MRRGKRATLNWAAAWRVPALVSLLALLVATFSACSLGAPTPKGPAPAPDAQQVFTVLKVGPSRGDLVSLDPQLLLYTAEYQIAKAIYTGLVTLDADANVVPDGADSWRISPDGLTYTFHIRNGIAWEDGTPITAPDFAVAIARSQDPCINKGRPSFIAIYLGGTQNELLAGARALNTSACPAGQAAIRPNPLIGPGKAIEVVDPHTLVLRLSKPAPYFLAALSSTTAMPVPARLVAADPNNWSQQELCAGGGHGSGPFICTCWDHPDAPEAGLILQRNPHYWGGKPRLRVMDFVLYRDTETPYTDYTAGKGDRADVPEAQLTEAKGLPGFAQVPRAGVEYLQPNRKIPPFDNLDARIAFDAAIDRAALADVRHGAVRPTTHYVVEGLPGYNAELRTSWGATGDAALHGDVVAARAHMQAYVSAPGSPCHGDIKKCPKVIYNFAANSSSSKTVAEALQGMWQAAFPGYPIAISNADGRGLIEDPLRFYQLPTVSWLMDYPADEDWYDNLLVSGAGQNYTKTSVPSADALVAQANATPDAASAEALYRQAEQLYVNDVAWIVTGQFLDSYVVRPHVVGYAESRDGALTRSVLLGMYIAR